MIREKSSCFSDEGIKRLYKTLKRPILKRLEEFRKIWEQGSDEDIFYELVFCLLTPASRAHAAWDTVCFLRRKGLLLNGSFGEVADSLNHVRFKNTKAARVIEAAERFLIANRSALRKVLGGFDSGIKRREWLVSEVRGLGYKEASHFLRNTGLSDGLAILDRHILHGLSGLCVIDEVPVSLSPARYLTIERKMQEYSQSIGVPVEHLDFVLWYMKTREIFK
ncbi:MAG: N-glycosylase/DNA lyase [Spirochaetota bacterium]